jgi:hypothetical protein
MYLDLPGTVNRAFLAQCGLRELPDVLQSVSEQDHALRVEYSAATRRLSLVARVRRMASGDETPTHFLYAKDSGIDLPVVGRKLLDGPRAEILIGGDRSACSHDGSGNTLRPVRVAIELEEKNL